MSTENESNKMDTLFGGRKVVVIYADGTQEEITVRQLRLVDYDEAFKRLKDEMELVAFICGKAKQWLLGQPPHYEKAVRPESYEMLQGVAWEVNAAGFFSYIDRKVRQSIADLNGLSPDKVKLVVERAAQVSKSTSPTSSPAPQPRPV